LARTQINAREQWGDQCSQNNISPVSPTAPTVNGGQASAAQIAQSLRICQALMGAGNANYYQNLAFPVGSTQYNNFLRLQPATPNGQVNTTVSATGNPNV